MATFERLEQDALQSVDYDSLEQDALQILRERERAARLRLREAERAREERERERDSISAAAAISAPDMYERDAADRDRADEGDTLRVEINEGVDEDEWGRHTGSGGRERESP